jgi:glycosyltransferase involved in cell wall biosynthesis
MFRHVHQITRTTHFDVVHLDTVFLARYLEAVSGTPAVLNHHNVESHLLRTRATSQRTPWGRAFFSGEARKVFALERAVVPRVAGNIVVSPLDGERLRQAGSTSRITTVPNGVDVDFFRVSGRVAVDEASLVFAGGMDWFPNRDAMEFFASEIWPTLSRDHPHRTMTVIGRNPPQALLGAARDRRLRVLGFVDDVRPHIEAASIYVCPIRVGGGTRLKILDALALSRPLVSTDLGVEGLGLVEGEHYLAANDPAQFVSHIRRLEADAELRARLGDAGRAFVVQRYSWRGIADSLEQAYANAARAGEPVSGWS